MKKIKFLGWFLPLLFISLLLYTTYYFSSKNPTPNIDEILTPETTKSEQIEESVIPSTPISEIPSKDSEKIAPSFINHDSVPFTTQAPEGDWSDQRQQDGCEEASALMAVYWARGQNLTKETALQEILNMSEYEKATYGEYRDISLADVKEWIFEDYFSYNNIEHLKNIQDIDIITALEEGSIVLLPLNGQKLHNPNFTTPGPERHMLVVRGYDPVTDEFITNDPGTRRGKAYRYPRTTIFNAILVYPTGYHELADESLKEMLVVKK